MTEQGQSPTGRRESTGEQPTLLASAAAPTLSWVGREVAGRYRVLDRIGQGGMGVVYVAEHLHLKKKVAFKVIHPELAADAELLLRFKREALATGQLDHPHIAAAIDFDQLPDGVAFMVMPWVRGHSLQVEIDRNGKVDLRRACRLGAQIADALSAAHALGIVHRDLKPDNVLVERRSDGSECCTVLDFGVASLTGRAERISVDTSRPLTQAGTILGTPGYMSPEQATAGETDHRTDLYALGVMLWELCRGKRLFQGDDVTAIFAKQFNVIPPALSLDASESAKQLSQLVQSLLAWNKQDRPNSAIEVRDVLRRIADAPEAKARFSAVSVTVRDVLRRIADAPEHDAGAKFSARSMAFKVPRKARIAAGVLLVFSAGVVWAWPDADDEPAQPPTTKTPPAAVAVREPAPPAIERPRVSPPTNTRVTLAASGLTPELQTAQADLMTSLKRDVRRKAARLIRKHPDRISGFMALLAEFELASRCSEKRARLVEMSTLGDPRVLPGLERLAETPRRGCGMFGLGDCIACVRRDLNDTITALQPVSQ